MLNKELELNTNLRAAFLDLFQERVTTCYLEESDTDELIDLFQSVSATPEGEALILLLLGYGSMTDFRDELLDSLPLPDYLEDDEEELND